MANKSANKQNTLRVLLVITTIILFGYYFANNSDQFSRIGELSFLEVALIVLGQSIVIASNIVMLMILLRYVSRRIPVVDAARVTAYSSLINFFGFLQGGVGFRGLYLKRTYGMPLRTYLGLTTVQYFLFFSASGALLLLGLGIGGNGKITLLLLLAATSVCATIYALAKFTKLAFIRSIFVRIVNISEYLRGHLLLSFLIASLVQLAGSLLANYVELSSIGANVTLSGLLVYTGISQFAIVVAVTPGAIGVREAILLVAQQQMSLVTSDIVVAATIDRAIYCITLALFSPFAIGAKQLLRR